VESTSTTSVPLASLFASATPFSCMGVCPKEPLDSSPR
jgi:hypothetical protein